MGWATRAAGMCAWGMLCACGGTDDGSVAAAAAAVDAHRTHYAHFSTWAQRAEHVQRRAGGAVVAETAFAPIRLDRAVIAAFLDVPGVPTAALPAGAALPEQLPWVRLRDAQLGPVQVSRSTPCAVHVPKWWRADVEGCLLLATERPTASGRPMRIIVAYALPGDAPDAP